MIPGRRFFNKPPGLAHRTTRSHHLHIVEYQTAAWQNPILFRDYLRSHPELAKEYETLKRSLASAEYENPSDYSMRKADFVARVLGLATATGRKGSSNA